MHMISANAVAMLARRASSARQRRPREWREVLDSNGILANRPAAGGAFAHGMSVAL
jgi:hypothetical protein